MMDDVSKVKWNAEVSDTSKWMFGKGSVRHLTGRRPVKKNEKHSKDLVKSFRF